MSLHHHQEFPDWLIGPQNQGGSDIFAIPESIPCKDPPTTTTTTTVTVEPTDCDTECYIDFYACVGVCAGDSDCTKKCSDDHYDCVQACHEDDESYRYENDL